MNTEQQEEKDYFWFYIGGLATVLITIVLMVQQTESDKFSPIRQLINEENASMNIRVLKDYEL
jgi:formate hydrogenlyase subunit 3/multisubunit Na+/H+ antiporter MnhD subunit